jgi:hypothetical protein
MSQFEEFLGDIESVLKSSTEPFELGNWVGNPQYFELLKTNSLETLNQSIRSAGGRAGELLPRLDWLVMQRQLLNSQFEDFFAFTRQNDVFVPPQLRVVIENRDTPWVFQDLLERLGKPEVSEKRFNRDLI